MDKPTVLLIEEFKQNISKVITESNLPAFILEYILKDIYMEISDISKSVTQREIEQYNTQIQGEE